MIKRSSGIDPPNGPTSTEIRSWKAFSRRVRRRGCGLLRRLDAFPDSVLVTGCQRSGTTALARIVMAADEITGFRFGKDEELDGALILAGITAHIPTGRYCFQTTYLNECYHEYFEHRDGHRIIWVLRNPFSVVYSMLRNWRRFALDELFLSCGRHLANTVERRRMTLMGRFGVSSLRKACYAYAGKTAQLFEMVEHFSEKEMAIVDYDELVTAPSLVLAAVFDFAALPYHREYEKRLHSKSIKKADRFSARDRADVAALCMPVYKRAYKLKNISAAEKTSKTSLPFVMETERRKPFEEKSEKH